jgi:polyadenylate-binding protein
MSISRQSILFVSGLHETVNEAQLYLLFNEYQITYIKIAKDHSTRKSFGYAFIGFKNHSKAEDAMIRLNFARIANRTIRISWYNRDPNNIRSRSDFNIFVKKIAKNVSPKEFYDYFSKFGNIVSSKLVEDDFGESVGYGFIQFDNENSSTMAINQAHLSSLKGKALYVGKFIKNKPKKQPQFNTVYVKNIPKVLFV